MHLYVVFFVLGFFIIIFFSCGFVIWEMAEPKAACLEALLLTVGMPLRKGGGGVSGALTETAGEL